MKAIPEPLPLGVLIVAAAAAVLLFTPLGARPLGAILSVGKVERIDFAALRLTDKPNQHLVCPPGYCAAKPHADSPVYDVTAVKLADHWRKVLAQQPRTILLAADTEGAQVDYVQRSARLRFPDIITVRFIPVSSSRSTLAIYSRSIYGHSDFGVNRERIEAWLKLLRERL